ncbi:hypothetical protein CEXT_144211 [Caerostris extrusa]|uniref:Uncharacterized protein n=1 Tax=Caerostris extrusa TaxID=172846 RepID=A0AAV4VA94_CAEEX|nr:hypothetical protein CEXT_144211 [Caerostris extrusa]
MEEGLPLDQGVEFLYLRRNSNLLLFFSPVEARKSSLEKFGQEVLLMNVIAPNYEAAEGNGWLCSSRGRETKEGGISLFLELTRSSMPARSHHLPNTYQRFQGVDHNGHRAFS